MVISLGTSVSYSGVRNLEKQAVECALGKPVHSLARVFVLHQTLFPTQHYSPYIAGPWLPRRYSSPSASGAGSAVTSVDIRLNVKEGGDAEQKIATVPRHCPPAWLLKRPLVGNWGLLACWLLLSGFFPSHWLLRLSSASSGSTSLPLP